MTVQVNYWIYLFAICVSFETVACTVTWYGFDTSSSMSENADSATTLDSFSASCYLEWDDCHWLDIFSWFCDRDSTSVACSCSISSNPAPGLYSITGSTSQWNLVKSECSQKTCGNYPSATSCSTSNGCASAGSHTITIRCQGSNSEDSTSATKNHVVTYTSETPSFSITNLDGSASATRLQSVNTVIFSTTTTAGLTVYEWVESSSVSNSWLLGTSNLFRLNTGNGQVYINSNPTLEYHYTFYMTICSYSRRQSDCGQLTINFSGCYQRPTCNSKTNTVADTHTVGGTLFTMTVPGPTNHFPSVSASFQGLGFVIKSSDLSVASIDSSTGEITTTGNVTVHPSYPDKIYTIVVTVSNTQSCTYTSDCTMTLTATFTNWPIEIRNLDASVTIHEDTDARTLMYTIITYDYNHPDEDNVTCVPTYISDPTLFELTSDGSVNSSYEYNSYRIWKKVCQDTGCGWLCALNIGCMSHNITQTYTFSVRCTDAYGSSDTGTLTINVRQNEAPVWTNLPRTIIVNTDAVADLDIIYSFYYSDYENENLDYNYTISPAQPTETLFSFDPWGNYYSQPANVTALKHQWPLQNASYTLYVCGTERRNTICDTLIIQIREFCGPTPSCTSTANTVSDQFATDGTIFTINVPAPATGSYTSLSYSIHSPVDLFYVNSATGVVKTKAALPVTNPPVSTVYSITANVFDTAACKYAVCVLTLTVTFTNFPISIDNMGSVTSNLHEDTKAENTLLTIATSDPSPSDNVTCAIDGPNSVPANNDKFLVRETYRESNVYSILNREAPGFDYDMTSSYTVAVTCSDAFGSSASASMVVTIDENAQPVITNLPTTVNVDPVTTLSGSQIFTLSTTDAENDPLTHYCNVTDTEVPLECATAGVVSLRRNMTVPADNGKTFQIMMCVIDSSHSHTVCNTLSVLMTASKTNPVISNLPATVNFDESSSTGTILFTLAVTDPDAGDIHTYRLENIYPQASASMFSFSQTTGVLLLAASLNYESQISYNFTFSVTDTYLPGLAYKTLYLLVNDINEAPSLTIHTITFNTTEGNTGQVIGTVLYTCSDVDSGQTMSLSITSGTHMSYFNLDANAQLSFAQNWDFESGSVGLSTVLVLTCSDGVGLTDSGSITVYVTPVNEFAPVPSITSIVLTIYSTQTLQHALFSVTATDADFLDDGSFVFSIPGNGIGSQYFTISSTGSVYLSNYINWSYNYTFQFTVDISDGETFPKSGSVDVTIHYVAPETTVNNERPTKCLTCTIQGKLVLATLIISGFMIVLLFIHACIRTRMWTMCRRKAPTVGTFDDVRKARSRQDVKQQRRKTLEDILKEEEESSSSDEDNGRIRATRNSRYTISRQNMNRALPKVQPPGPMSYTKLPRTVDLPDAAVYSPGGVNASILSEPRVMPDSYHPPPSVARPGFAFPKLSAFDNPVKRISKSNQASTVLAPSPSPGNLYYSAPHNPAGYGPQVPETPMFVKRPPQVGAVPVAYQTKTGPMNTRRSRHAVPFI